MKLQAMEHNTLSENAFWGKLEGESSCECHKYHCSDGQFFLLVITLSCNIILIYSFKKRSDKDAVEGAEE